jgi:hypothetical protein
VGERKMDLNEELIGLLMEMMKEEKEWEEMEDEDY